MELIESRGGKCEVCGYDKNIAALEFHHINPDEKEFQLDMRHLSNTSLVQVEARDKVSFNNPTGSVCPVCGKRFPKSKGKIYCSKECREKDKNYPSKQEVLEQYELLKTWDKVAEYFGLTRRIIQRIRNQ